VDPVPEQTSRRLLQAIDDYGDVTLIPLPEAAWDSSVALWYGDRWRCLVDLWTKEEGRSDLVLDADVFEHGSTYRFSLNAVYIP
jgi:hypothetical protein